ncbi:MAG: hypothetical protein PUB68_06115, partial [Lachnospiraceae bacterium]|nr:hypothetical protein [Lachnospiraceae bacterium]
VDNSNRIINSSGHIDAAKNRFNETNCPDFDGTYYTTTIYAYWVDDIGPEEDSTYLTVTKRLMIRIMCMQRQPNLQYHLYRFVCHAHRVHCHRSHGIQTLMRTRMILKIA